MKTDLLGEEVLEDYAEWREVFMREYGVKTFEWGTREEFFCAFIGDWDKLNYDINNLTLYKGQTEREALERLAECRGVALF